MTAIDAGPWPLLRHELRDTVARFTALLRTVRHPGSTAVGSWGVAETAAHVAVVCGLNVHTASAGTEPFLVPAALELVPRVNVDQIARINALAAAEFTERRVDVLADQVDALVERLLTVTADADPTALWPWLGGARVTTTFLVCHTLNELLVHGHDIATAERRPWPIAPPVATLIFDVFVLGLLRGDSGVLFRMPTYRPGRVRATVHLPFLRAPVTLVGEHGRLYIDKSGEPPDLHLWAAPTTLMMVLWRRSGVARPLLTGSLRVWGRRPWLAPRFLASARNP